MCCCHKNVPGISVCICNHCTRCRGIMNFILSRFYSGGKSLSNHSVAHFFEIWNGLWEASTILHGVLECVMDRMMGSPVTIGWYVVIWVYQCAVASFEFVPGGGNVCCAACVDMCSCVKNIYTVQLQVLHSPLDKGNITHICKVMWADTHLVCTMWRIKYPLPLQEI